MRLVAPHVHFAELDCLLQGTLQAGLWWSVAATSKTHTRAHSRAHIDTHSSHIPTCAASPLVKSASLDALQASRLAHKLGWSATAASRTSTASAKCDGRASAVSGLHAPCALVGSMS